MMRKAGVGRAIGWALALAACAGAPVTSADPVLPMEPAAAPSPVPAPAEKAALDLHCAGALIQGGIALCRTAPAATLWIDGKEATKADQTGLAVIGFDRDSNAMVQVEARLGGVVATQELRIAPQSYRVQRVDGLPPQTVTPTEPAVLKKIERDSAAKAKAFASQAAIDGFLDGFAWPVEGRVTGPFGAQRILNGEPRSPHYGVDLALPTGSPIRAPASGLVVLAQADMHFEGGLVLIDHGQGLVSMYLHMSRIDVAAGQEVAQGQSLGAVGASGRATGPHLCWRMRWRGRHLDPSLAIDGLARAKTELGL